MHSKYSKCSTNGKEWTDFIDISDSKRENYSLDGNDLNISTDSPSISNIIKEKMSLVLVQQVNLMFEKKTVKEKITNINDWMGIDHISVEEKAYTRLPIHI